MAPQVRLHGPRRGKQHSGDQRHEDQRLAVAATGTRRRQHAGGSPQGHGLGLQAGCQGRADLPGHGVQSRQVFIVRIVPGVVLGHEHPGHLALPSERHGHGGVRCRRGEVASEGRRGVVVVVGWTTESPGVAGIGGDASELLDGLHEFASALEA